LVEERRQVAEAVVEGVDDGVVVIAGGLEHSLAGLGVLGGDDFDEGASSIRDTLTSSPSW
jgi:hypothetical protein